MCISDINQTEKEKYSMLSLTCGIEKIKECLSKNSNKFTDVERKLKVTSGEKKGRRGAGYG